MDQTFISACINNQLSIAERILNSGIDFPANYVDAFEESCTHGSLDIAKWLHFKRSQIKGPYRDTVNYPYVFENACTRNDIEMAKWLFSLGQSINYNYMFSFLFAENKFELAIWLHDQGVVNLKNYKNTSFLFANKNLEMVKWLYSLYPTTNLDSILIQVCGICAIDVAEFFISEGASIGKNNKDYHAIIYGYCRNGELEMLKWIMPKLLPLTHFIIYGLFEIAFKHGHIKILEYLLTLGELSDNDCFFIFTEPKSHVKIDTVKWFLSYFDIKDHIDGVFVKVCFEGDIETVEYVLSKGANVNNHYVFANLIGKGKLEIAKLLVSKGFDLTFVDMNDLFVLSCRKQYDEIALWLYSSELIDVHYKEDDAYKEVLARGNLKMLKWLMSIDKPRRKFRYFEILAFVQWDKKADLFEFLKIAVPYIIHTDLHHFFEKMCKLIFKNKIEILTWFLTFGVDAISGNLINDVYENESLYHTSDVSHYCEGSKFLYKLYMDKSKIINIKNMSENEIHKSIKTLKKIESLIEKEKNIYVEIMKKVLFGHPIVEYPMFDENIFLVEIAKYLFYLKN